MNSSQKENKKLQIKKHMGTSNFPDKILKSKQAKCKIELDTINWFREISYINMETTGTTGTTYRDTRNTDKK